MRVRHERDLKAAELVSGLIAYATGVPVDAVLAPTRGATEAAVARQAAMYLTHVVFDMSLARVADAFGRDRSTVAHACHQMEDRREDPDVDLWLEDMERALRRAPPALSPPAALGMAR